MSGRRVVAGIDSSTQSTTVVLRDIETGETVSVGRGAHPPTTPPVSEQDPDDWWSALATAMGVAMEQSPGVEVAAVSVGAQSHGLVPLDANGQVIRPAKLWNDTTSVPEARELVDRLSPPEWSRRAGSVPPGAFTISKLLWLRRHEPESFDQLATVLLPHDWVTSQLSGRYVCDPSDASGTGYYSPADHQWDTGLLALVDPDVDWAAQLPTLIRFDETVGEVTARAAQHLGLGSETLVGPGGADNQTSALGLGLELGDIVMSLGTSGVVFARTAAPVCDPSGAVNGTADAAGGYLPLLCTLNAAKVTDTFSRLLGVGHDEMSQLALNAAVDDPTRPVLVAYLDGERAPDRPDAAGTLAGVRTDSTREQVARAAFEGVLAGLVLGLRQFEDLGVDVSGRLAVTGGGARSPAYRQLLADLTGRPVFVVDQVETAAAGAAIQAAAVVCSGSVDEYTAAWSPTWQVAAEPRAGAGPDDFLARYAAVSDWQGLE